MRASIRQSVCVHAVRLCGSRIVHSTCLGMPGCVERNSLSNSWDLEVGLVGPLGNSWWIQAIYETDGENLKKLLVVFTRPLLQEKNLFVCLFVRHHFFPFPVLTQYHQVLTSTALLLLC